ncbi:MAG: GAF domain-containing protein [Desulfobacterales bacterium]|nr:MAG: GAF domain-containing protein [Desulfobacterales bacterium]
METVERKNILSKILFNSIVTATAAISLLYLYNIFKWKDAPEFGFGFRNATGIHVVGVVREHGQKAGLQAGDLILKVNGKTYKNYVEFNSAKQWGLDEQNIYLLQRRDQQLEVTVENIPLGLKKTIRLSGFPFLVGLCYFSIGTIVFLMKPHRRTSWVFFSTVFNMGLMLTFLFKAGVMKPFWLENVILFAYCFLPAGWIHLALCFPEERLLLKKYSFSQFVPYAISTFLLISIRIITPTFLDVPRTLLIILSGYMVIGIIVLLGSTIQLRLTSLSEMVRIRARMIILGTLIASSIPLLDFTISALFQVYLVPSFNYYLPFFIAFPSFIAYSIVKHDLFDIDAIIKRTYGYILTTGTIAGLYGIIVLVSNLAFGGFEFAKSPVFPLVFILAVVFLFNPIRNRVQRVIDRVFYRLEYDYQETVEKIGETMRSLLNLDEIGKSIMHFALQPMFVDAGAVMILNKEKQSYDCLIQSGDPEQKKNNREDGEFEEKDAAEKPPAVQLQNLAFGEPFISKMAEWKKTVTIYDIWEDPFFDDNRYECMKTLEQFGAKIVVPLIYEDQLTGLISLGRKKSGKFYRREDINLLNTLANQGAMAIENARMVDEIIEKERLKTKIMDAFGKYVTHEVRDQILEGRIPLDGETKDVTVLFADLRDFTTLAESTPPKEVIKIINGYFSEMADAIVQHHGLVLQFIGDEIEAVFGAPLALENHPTHAARAALAMRERLVLVNDKLQQQGYRHLSHGIGIHTGNVVAANIGSEDRLSYALVGDTVNVASRIQGLNKEFNTDILISATTRARLEDSINVEKLPATTVKGKIEPVEIFKLIQI